MICNHRVLHMNPPLKVEQFQSLQCNFGALPRDGPEAVYHRSAGESLSDVPTTPPPLSSYCYRMVKIAPSLIESKHWEVIELGLFL